MSLSKDLTAATAEPLILSILARDDSYGYALIKEVQALSGGRVKWTEGMLYPVLHRLEQQGYIKAEWRASETGRQRKYYCLQNSGKKRLTSQLDQWQLAHGLITASLAAIGGSHAG